jgi:hypothetical protein
MKGKEINSGYDAIERLVKIIESEKEEGNEKNEYEIYLEKAEAAVRKAEAAARKAEMAAQKAEAAAWKAVKGFKKSKRQNG